MESTASVEIARPIAEVFDYTLNKVPEWSITVKSDEVIEDKGGLGDTFKIVTEEQGREMEFDGVVTKYELNKLSAIRLTGKMFDIEAEYSFEDLGGKTRVTQESKVYGKGFFKVMLFLLGWMMKKKGCEATQKELDSLKAKLESGAAAQSA